MNIKKIQELQQWMKANQIDLSYVSNPSSIAYLSGFESDPHERVLALFIPSDKEPFLFTPAMEIESAKAAGFTFDVIGYQDTQDPWQIIVQEITNRYSVPQHLALEKNALVVDRFERLIQAFQNTDFSADITNVLQKMQLIKTKEELNTLLEAGNWADVAFEIGFKALKENVSEQEIVAEIEYQLKRRGVAKMSFDTLILFGANAANPHGTPGALQLQPNQLALFDLGVIWKGYCSDATRTVSFKEPTKQQITVYETVLKAQKAAQAAVKPGISAQELDKIARDIITDAGFGEYFTHRLGHGIGTTVHEYPSIVAGNDLIIEEGMCFSIEPGIYIPNEVGVRIEDCVYVTKAGCIPLTQTPKELRVID